MSKRLFFKSFNQHHHSRRCIRRPGFVLEACQHSNAVQLHAVLIGVNQSISDSSHNHNWNSARRDLISHCHEPVRGPRNFEDTVLILSTSSCRLLRKDLQVLHVLHIQPLSAVLLLLCDSTSYVIQLCFPSLGFLSTLCSWCDFFWDLDAAKAPTTPLSYDFRQREGPCFLHVTHLDSSLPLYHILCIAFPSFNGCLFSI